MTEDKWTGYKLRSSWLIESPDDPLAPELRDVLLRHLQFEIGNQGSDAAWQPFWIWKRDVEHWPMAEQAWKGILTVRLLRVMKNFGFIERN